MDADLYFANADGFKEQVAKKMAKSARHFGEPVRYVILDMSPMTRIDITGLDVRASRASLSSSPFAHSPSFSSYFPLPAISASPCAT